jgi:hypothetical protein
MTDAQYDNLVQLLSMFKSETELKLSSIQSQLDAIRDDIRKINKFVPFENADFLDISIKHKRN